MRPPGPGARDPAERGVACMTQITVCKRQSLGEGRGMKGLLNNSSHARSNQPGDHAQGRSARAIVGSSK